MNNKYKYFNHHNGPTAVDLGLSNSYVIVQRSCKHAETKRRATRINKVWKPFCVLNLHYNKSKNIYFTSLPNYFDHAVDAINFAKKQHHKILSRTNFKHVGANLFMPIYNDGFAASCRAPSKLKQIIDTID